MEHELGTRTRKTEAELKTGMFELTGKIAIVTGASRGIGRGIASLLAARGAIVVAAARGEHAAPVVSEIVAAGGHAELASVDVTDAGTVDALVSRTIERHGRIDILVNNAGIARDQLMLRMKRDDWDAVLATNLTAAFTLAQAAIRPMLRQRCPPPPCLRPRRPWPTCWKPPVP